MAAIGREITATLNSFRARGYHVCQDWLTGCINFFRSEHNQYTSKELEDFVFEQWLLADLREIAGVGSFPSNLTEILKTTLQGKMACQIESITDIGHSSYSQMQKVRDEDVGNLNVDEIGKEFQQAWEPKSNRMLKLSLCDGIQTITAIEYRPIPTLRIDLVPGVKGPILCRRGILMLEERHVTVLGGEVDALVISNAYENVLARKLNVPENPDPYNMSRVQNQLPVASMGDCQNIPPPTQHPVRQAPPPENPQQVYQPLPKPHQQPPQQTSIQQSIQQPPHPKPKIQSRVCNPIEVSRGNNERYQHQSSWSNAAQQTENSTSSITTQNHPLEFCGSDEDFLNIPMNDEWDLEWENENRHVPPYRPPMSNSAAQIKNSTTSSNRNDEYEMNPEEEAILLAAEAEALFNSDSACEVNSSVSASTQDGISSVAQKSVTDKSSFKRPLPSAHSEESLRKPLFPKRRKETSSQEVSSTTDVNLIKDEVLDFEETFAGKPETIAKLSINPFVYLSQVVQLKNKIPKIYRVKAAVITVIEKLSISDGNWKLSAKISDGSANVDVRFSSEVLEELIGMSPKTMTELKKQMIHQPEKKEIVRKRLESAQGRLINLNCLLNIQVCRDQDLPFVVGLNELSTQTIDALRDRLSLVP